MNVPSVLGISLALGFSGRLVKRGGITSTTGNVWLVGSGNSGCSLQDL